MTSVVWTEQALADVIGIRDFIARDAPGYAEVIVDRIFESVARLRDFPRSGHCKQRQRELTAPADDELNRVQKEDPSVVERFFDSKAFAGLRVFYGNNLPWEAGRYSVQFEVRLLRSNKPLVGPSHFSLTDTDIDSLRRNVQLLEQRLAEIARSVPEEQRANPSYWATPLREDREIHRE